MELKLPGLEPWLKKQPASKNWTSLYFGILKVFFLNNVYYTKNRCDGSDGKTVGLKGPVFKPYMRQDN